MAVGVAAQPDLRVVDVQRAEALLADQRDAVIEDLGEAVAPADVEAAGVQVARVQAQAEALAAAGRLHEVCELVERAPQRAAAAGGVLQVQWAAIGLGERLADDGARALDGGGDLAGL